MGLGRCKVERQFLPTSREVLPVRRLRGWWSCWGTGMAWGSQTALQMSGVRWRNAPSSLAPLCPPYTGLGPLCPRNQPSKCPEQEAAPGETNEALGTP